MRSICIKLLSCTTANFMRIRTVVFCIFKSIYSHIIHSWVCKKYEYMIRLVDFVFYTQIASHFDLANLRFIFCMILVNTINVILSYLIDIYTLLVLYIILEYQRILQFCKNRCKQAGTCVLQTHQFTISLNTHSYGFVPAFGR